MTPISAQFVYAYNERVAMMAVMVMFRLSVHAGYVTLAAANQRLVYEIPNNVDTYVSGFSHKHLNT